MLNNLGCSSTRNHGMDTFYLIPEFHSALYHPPISMVPSSTLQDTWAPLLLEGVAGEGPGADGKKIWPLKSVLNA